jgi:DNA polymerase-1
MLTSAQVWVGVQEARYTLINSLPLFQEMIEFLENKPMLAVDTESSGLDWVRSDCCGVVLGVGLSHNYYVPIDHKNNIDGGRSYERQLTLQDVLEPLKKLLGNPKTSYIFHNAKFDLHMLRKMGIEVLGI